MDIILHYHLYQSEIRLIYLFFLHLVEFQNEIKDMLMLYLL